LWYVTEFTKMTEDGMVARVTTDSSSPWFTGHFPGDPILPGIAQLKMVADLIAGFRNNEVYLTGLSRVRFKKIVRPGEPLDIHAVPANKENQYAFRITSSGRDICSGVMLFAAKDLSKANL
jgi:3-hydroxyacyl-[acyl-carrier-protein] dehydratase